MKSILQEGLPIGAGFPNWRSASEKQIRLMLNLPVAGLCYEIARGKFWWDQWGSRPLNTDEALEIARSAFKNAPVLVPIYCHCYIPCSPNIAGNPIFFVYEKDIYYCGYDLADFFEREVFVPLNFLSTSDPAFIGGEDSCLDFLKLNSGSEKQNASETSMNFIHEHMAVEPKAGVQRERPEATLEISGERLDSELNTADVRWRCEFNGDIPGDSKPGDGEIFSRKSLCEESSQPLERPLTLVKSAGNSPRSGQNIMSRYTYFYEQPLPTKVLALLTIAAPPWAAKRARHVHLWSDLAERKESSNNDSQAEPHFSSYTLEVDVKSPIMKHTELVVEVDDAAVPRRSNKRWLGGYLKQLEKRLRRGGWKQNEIQEMVDAVSPEERSFPKQSGEEILNALLMSVNSMSASLRKAGWSAQDVWEILSFDVKRQQPKHNCRTANNTGVGKLADFLA